MSLTHSAATARIARQLKEAEQKADEALLAASELMATLVRSRASNGVVPHTGQAALLRLVQAQKALIEGSSGLFRVHNEMSMIGQELGLLDEENSTPQFAERDGQIERAVA